MHLPLGLVGKPVKWGSLTLLLCCRSFLELTVFTVLLPSAAGLVLIWQWGLLGCFTPPPEVAQLKPLSQPSLPHLCLPGSHEQQPLPASSVPLS